MHEADDHVGDLHPGVVDVVLHFDAIAGGAQNVHERVAEHRIAHMTDVGGLIGIDAGVLDHQLAACLFAKLRLVGNFRRSDRNKFSQQLSSIIKDVEISGAGNVHACNFVNCFQERFQAFGNQTRRAFLAGLLLNLLREFEGDRKRQVAQLSARGNFTDDLFEFHAVRFTRGYSNTFLNFGLKLY